MIAWEKSCVKVIITKAAAGRDRAMADNVLWALQREGRRGRIVLWAHNYHIVMLLYPKIGPSLGLFLDSILGPDYVSVGFTFYQGAKIWLGVLANRCE